MKTIFHPVFRLLDRVQRRFTRARAGSVLILVVGLLVVLALMATAMISSTRIDRYTTAQNVANTQIGVLADSVLDLTEGAIRNDVVALAGSVSLFRPASSSVTVYTYDNFDAPNDISDYWMASRVPTLSTIAGGNRPVWSAISYPLIRTGANFQFDSPFSNTPAASILGTTRKENYVAVIERVTNNGIDYPALRLYDQSTGAAVAGPFLAADADGDGIADAGLWKLPIGQVNGVTYYAAIRIIDNNSAVNANTAWSRSQDLDNFGTAVANRGYFTSQVGLLEMLSTYSAASLPTLSTSSEIDALNAARFNGVNPNITDPVSDTNVARTDFDFNTRAEAFFFQSNRRLGTLKVGVSNPGYNTTSVKYKPLETTDTSLLYRFCLVNPLSQSPLETYLASSLYNFTGAPTRPYGAGSYYQWFDRNFNYDRISAGIPSPIGNSVVRPIRSILVTNNPVSNVSALHDMTGLLAGPLGSDYSMPKDGGALPPATTDRMPNVTGNNHPPTKVSINTATFGELWRGFWNVMCDDPRTTPFDPVATMPTDMYQGMKFTNPITPDPTTPLTYDTLTNTWPAPTFGQAGASVNTKFSDYPAVTGIGTDHPLRMFRTSMRHPSTQNPAFYAKFDSYNMMLLRSAIAAVNTYDLRGTPQNLTYPAPPATAVVTEQSVMLTGDVSGTISPLMVKVYGTKKQPFISEVYVNNDNTTGPAVNASGYICIELYNPYDEDIDLTGWELQVVDRGAFPVLAPETIHRFTGTEAFFKVRNAGLGKPYLIIDNLGGGTGGAAYQPGASSLWPTNKTGEQKISIPALGRAIGRELILVRPTNVHPSLTISGVSYPYTDYLEGAPVDSFDFSGMLLATGDPAPTLGARPDTGVTWVRAWHYCRPTDTSVGQWKFVYPGRYDGDANASRRHQGVIEEVYRVPTGNIDGDVWDPWKTPSSGPLDELHHPRVSPIVFGEAETEATYPASHTPFTPDWLPTIQLAAIGWAGPNPIPGTPNLFPHGGFARVGDVMQTTFFGGYRVLNDTGTSVREINSVTMDCAFAEDTDVTDDPVEQIGRFAPLSAAQRWRSGKTYNAGELVMHNAAAPPANADTLYYTPSGSNNQRPDTAPLTAWTPIADYYSWANDLFDYFTTVNNPHDDNFPNVAPANYPAGTPPEAVANTLGPTANAYNEDWTPVQGLVNINTAPWYVLAQLPLLPNTAPDAAGGPETNSQVPQYLHSLAHQIAYYRDVDDGLYSTSGVLHPHGPFRNLFELNQVSTSAGVGQGFQDGWNQLTMNPDAGWGDTSLDGVINDFEYRYMMLNRISNLVTTRSDSFAAYILLQGWRGAGTPNAQLVAQRRLVYQFDRSRMTKSTDTVDKTPVNSN